MNDLIERQVIINELESWLKVDGYSEGELNMLKAVLFELQYMPSAQPDLNEWCTDCKEYNKEKHHCPRFNRVIREAVKDAQPERYTKEELKIFLHGLSLRLLSLRSAQHWQEDDETAIEIEFLAHLYEKVKADMKGKA